MINLLDSKDIFQRVEGNFDLINQFDLILRNKLEEGYKNKELIYTQELRGIGKTYELIQYAKKHDLNVVVVNSKIACRLKQDFSYEGIYDQSSFVVRNIDCIIDEGVNIELLKEKNVNILTGFSMKKNQTIKKGRIICKECKQEIDEKDFYLINNERIHICKKCVTDKYEYKNLTQFIKLLIDIDIPFIQDLYIKYDTVGEYLKYINLPQHKELNFKNSIFKENNQINNDIKATTNNDLIEILDNEVQQLIIKINKSREMENWGTYKNLILALGEVMKLKEKEIEKDWQLKHSEYKLDDENGKKQVSIWEQNSDGQIRNHKVWDVREKENNKELQSSINVILSIENQEEVENAIKEFEEKMKNIKIGLKI